MIDLNALVVFAKVVETGSFSEAARRLHMPVSTISRRIAELEEQLGFRLLERSTRRLRLTDAGGEILSQSQRSAEVNEAVENIISNNLAQVSGTLRLSAPPNISDTLLVPLAHAFQASYPEVRIEIFVTQRMVDPISDGVDLMLRVGRLDDSTLVARRLLRYRHQLVAAPEYIDQVGPLEHPDDLLKCRLVSFSLGEPQRKWRFESSDGADPCTLSFVPHLAMNDYAGVAAALLTKTSIGDLPPIVRSDLLTQGRLVEVMPQWHFPVQDLSIVHLGNRLSSRPVRLFKEFAARMAPSLFPNLPQ